jgi:hypothetical protein
LVDPWFFDRKTTTKHKKDDGTGAREEVGGAVEQAARDAT